jgi:homoserine dehydrogenase
VGKALCRILSREDTGVDVVAVADKSSSTVERGGLDLKKVLLRKEKTGLAGARGSPSSEEIILDSEFDALVELTPANPENAEPGLSHISSALSAGRHVVTSSKMPLALRYSDLKRRAKSKGVVLKYGACVGGGIPILEFGDSCADAETVTSIDGVLNATSNFILSEMGERGTDFEKALREARALGYAEADPWLDLDGIDAAAKIVILTNHVLGREFVLKDVRPIEGLRELSSSEIQRRQKSGGRVRSLAIYDKRLQVKIVEIPADDPLCVSGAWNAVRFRCADSGERVVSGPAGGGVTTARAVLRDLLSIKSQTELN